MSMNELSTQQFNHTSECGQETHTFILTNLNGAKNIATTTVNFSVVVRESDETLEADCSVSKSILPVFNNDGKWFTPTFVLPFEKSQLSSNEKNIRSMFEKKVQESLLEKSFLLEPKPSSNYCHVCKETFDDYMKHVNHPIHLQKIEDNNYSYQISDLIQDFNANKQESKYKRSKVHDRNDRLALENVEGKLKKKRIVEDSVSFGRVAVSFCKDVASSTNFTSFQQKTKRSV